jgi:hypothetical protein
MRWNRQVLTILSLASLLFVAQSVSAQTGIGGSGSAFGISINLRVLPLLGNGVPVQVNPQPMVAGTAAPAFDQSAQLPALVVSTVATGRLLANGLLLVHATSAVPGADTAEADATADHLALSVPGNLPLLTVGADVVGSTVAISGSCSNGLTMTGGSTLAGLHLGGSLGAALGLSPGVSPPPNTVLLNVAGLRLVVNEQIPSAAPGVRGMTVNALHLSASNAPIAGLGLLTGDLVIAQSHAEMRCPNVQPPPPTQ